jgi:hypothetical protein
MKSENAFHSARSSIDAMDESSGSTLPKAPLEGFDQDQGTGRERSSPLAA